MRRIARAVFMILATSGAAVAPATAQGDAAARQVVVFTDRDPYFVDFLLNVFSIESGVDAVMRNGVPEDLATLRAKEPEARVDLVLTDDTAWIDELYRAGATAPIESEGLTERVRPALRDDQNRWLPVSLHSLALHVSKDRVEPGELVFYESLADPKWRGRLCTRSFNRSAMLQLVAAMIGHHGSEKARAWLAGVKENLARTPDGDDRDQIRFVADGRCDVALAPDYYRGFMGEIDVQSGFVAATRLEYPIFENGAWHVTPTVASVLADAGNPAETEALLDYLLSDKAQRILMMMSYEHPAADGARLEGAVASWGAFASDHLPLSELDAREGEAREMVQALVGALPWE